MFWFIVVLFSCVKLLLLPSYRSTDFEVHRNWLAITHSLPVSEWYYEATSQWTLDYPPLFAWFEFALSKLAQLLDPHMLHVKNVNYASPETVLFQRLSVIVTDFVFAYGVKECSTYLSQSGVRKSSKWRSRWESPTVILQMLLLGNAGLLLVDHVHFQYNGFLFGILLISVARILQARYISAAFWFAVLLNLKHIFVYIAPVYFVFLLRSYVLSGKGSFLQRLITLGGVVGTVFVVSLGPFVYHMPQVLSRLFPFKRGLCHAYWAPNFWALYTAVDKVAALAARKMGLLLSQGAGAMTGGLVQEFEHAVLPSVSPRVTFLVVTVTMLPALARLWRSPYNPLHFVRCLVLCAGASFLFGWHVHEKAVLLLVVPLSLLAVVWRREAELFLLLSATGHYSLLPLLFQPAEGPIKVLALLIHTCYSFSALANLFGTWQSSLCLPLLSPAESLYLLGLVPLFLFENVIHPLLGLDSSLPFLPLMLTSIYCSVGIMYCWLRYYVYFLTMNDEDHKRKAH